MSDITVRFVHRQSRTPVLELEVEASATIGELRELLMDRLASEEVCMMRVFAKWHAQIVLPGGKKRLIELTDEDECEPLDSHGISHLSEVHLDGPLTGECDEGVGQALAVLGAQMHRIEKGTTNSNTLLVSLVASAAASMQIIATIHYVSSRLTHLPSEAYLARQALAAEEGLAYGQLTVLEREEKGYQRLLAEAYFSIDRTTPLRQTFTISESGTTATKVSDGYTDSWVTFRSSNPLTAANHMWAVKIVEDCGKRGDLIIGLLPKLSDAQVAKMEGGNRHRCIVIGSKALGGWGIRADGLCRGEWQGTSFPFKKGDVVVCVLNFAAKTLSLSCGDRKAVGTIPSIKEGDELYPAVTMAIAGQEVVLASKLPLRW